MCGILGYWEAKRGASALLPRLRDGLDLIRHRGPDDQGIWTEDPHPVGLAMVRLSIQDLSSAGHQPMIGGNQRFVIVYNGEIFNFKELRPALESQGVPFHSHTDTEVLLNLWHREGAACLNRLNGMFAFALYDRTEKTLHLVRDRFGIKPLYVATGSGRRVFCSEIKGLLPWARCGDFPGWELNEDRLGEYMLFRHVAGRETLIRCVERVLPGEHWTIREDGTTTRELWYDLNARALELEPDPDAPYDECAAKEEIGGLLQDAIRLRMISDAPVGISLSGGVDSSLVTCLLRQRRPEPINTYSIVFDPEDACGRNDIDESPFSQWIAEKCSTRHHPIRLKEEEFCALYLKAAWLNDEPINFPNSLAVHLFSRIARPECTVLLGGEGADEVFGGYSFFADRNKLAPMKHAVLTPEFADPLVRASSYQLPWHDHVLALPLRSPVKKEIVLCMHTYLQSVENRLDKMSMGASLEFRVPFLDYRVVEAGLKLPAEGLVSPAGVTKAVIKRLAEDHMPREQIYRKKLGLSTPLNEWMANPARLGRHLDLLRPHPFLRMEGIHALLRAHRAEPDTRIHSKTGRLWLLLNLEVWHRMFIEQMRPMDDG